MDICDIPKSISDLRARILASVVARTRARSRGEVAGGTPVAPQEHIYPSSGIGFLDFDSWGHRDVVAWMDLEVWVEIGVG